MSNEKQDYNALNGLVLCSNCSHLLANFYSNKASSLTAVCRCGKLNVQKYRADALKNTTDFTPLVRRESLYFCGACENEIIHVNTANIVNIVFTVKCECGHICSSQKVIESVDRRLDPRRL